MTTGREGCEKPSLSLEGLVAALGDGTSSFAATERMIGSSCDRCTSAIANQPQTMLPPKIDNRAYLEQFNIQDTIRDAVGAVLKLQPPNPMKFLSEAFGAKA